MTPTATVQIIGSRGSVTLDAIIDTGFDGDLSIPITIAVNLGLELEGEEYFELADGTQTRELLFAGRASLAGRVRKAHILVSKSQDTLVGTRLLSGCELSISFPSGKARIRRKEK